MIANGRHSILTLDSAQGLRDAIHANPHAAAITRCSPLPRVHLSTANQFDEAIGLSSTCQAGTAGVLQTVIGRYLGAPDARALSGSMWLPTSRVGSGVRLGLQSTGTLCKASLSAIASGLGLGFLESSSREPFRVRGGFMVGAIFHRALNGAQIFPDPVRFPLGLH